MPPDCTRPPPSLALKNNESFMAGASCLPPDLLLCGGAEYLWVQCLPLYEHTVQVEEDYLHRPK